MYRDDRVMAFEDINPTAPQHVLIVPVGHVTFLRTADDSQEADRAFPMTGAAACWASRFPASRQRLRFASIELTRNEWDEAQRLGPRYRLFLVASVDSGPPRSKTECLVNSR